MKRRVIVSGLAGGLGSLLLGCAADATRAGDSAKKVSLDADADFAVTQLYAKIEGSKEMLSNAKGVLVFPQVISAGVVVGGSYGEDVLRADGPTLGYYSATTASVGLLAGAASRSMFVLFRTDDALYKFRASNGWTAGADASVALVSAGANGVVDTETSKAAVVGLVFSNGGLMANLSVEGTKVRRLFL